MIDFHIHINVPLSIKHGACFVQDNICPAHNYMFKVSNRNTKTSCEIRSKSTINTPKQRHWHRSGVFIVNFEHISHLALVFLLLTLSR